MNCLWTLWTRNKESVTGLCSRYNHMGLSCRLHPEFQPVSTGLRSLSRCAPIQTLHVKYRETTALVSKIRTQFKEYLYTIKYIMGEGSGRSPWRSKWLSTLVFLPGECHGQRLHSMGLKESGTTEQLALFFMQRRASLVAQTVTNLPANWETFMQSLGEEDALEKGMATHSSTLGWKIPWTEEPGGLQYIGVTKSQTQLSDFHF